MTFYQLNETEAASLLKNVVNIIHVHGHLGDYPDTQYGLTQISALPWRIAKAVQGIQVIHQAAAVSSDFERARRLIKAASKIVFVGFGYNELSLQRLGFPSISRGKSVLGSALGLYPRELEHIKEKLAHPELHRSVELFDQEALKFLRISGALL